MNKCVVFLSLSLVAFFQLSAAERKVYNAPDGSTFEGDFENCMSDTGGFGVHTMADGTRYSGQWKDGHKAGQGVVEWPNGAQYNGHWEDSSMNGVGVYLWPNGATYDGQWKDDKKNGRGVYSDESVSTYDGDWKDDKKWGHGSEVFYDNDGKRMYFSQWKICVYVHTFATICCYECIGNVVYSCIIFVVEFVTTVTCYV